MPTCSALTCKTSRFQNVLLSKARKSCVFLTAPFLHYAGTRHQCLYHCSDARSRCADSHLHLCKSVLAINGVGADKLFSLASILLSLNLPQNLKIRKYIFCPKHRWVSVVGYWCLRTVDFWTSTSHILWKRQPRRHMNYINVFQVLQCYWDAQKACWALTTFWRPRSPL